MEFSTRCSRGHDYARGSKRSSHKGLYDFFHCLLEGSLLKNGKYESYYVIHYYYSQYVLYRSLIRYASITHSDMSPKGKAENHQKKQFSLCKYSKQDTRFARNFSHQVFVSASQIIFCFLRCNPNRDINNAIKSAYKSLAKRHKAEKRV